MHPEEESCSACGSLLEGITVPYGLEFETFSAASEAAQKTSARIGCDVAVMEQASTGRWHLDLNEGCAYHLAERLAPGITIDHMNHPCHYVGQPRHILVADVTLEDALKYAAVVVALPGQELMISLESAWSVNASITSEEALQVKRLYAHFLDDGEMMNKLDNIDSFRDFVLEATSAM